MRFYSSLGFENGYEKTGCEGEFVTQCREPQDVEQYFHFEYLDLTPGALTEKVREALNTVRDRARAVRPPKTGVYDIVISDEQLVELLGFYDERSDGRFKYAGYFDVNAGDSVQGEDVKGERLNLVLVPAEPYSSEGIPMKERVLIKDGVLQCVQANERFASYLGIEPTGYYSRMRLENGTEALSEMKKGCLYPVSFSGFETDSFTGQFGGEIRLAYYYGDNGVEILTGGSINGILPEKHGELVFSKERYSDSGYEGPFAVKMRGVSVAGE